MPGLSVHYLSRRETGNLQQVDLNFDEPVDVVRVGLGTDNRSLVAIVRLRHMPPPPEPAMVPGAKPRSEEHTSELQSLMRISYAVFCLKKKKLKNDNNLQRQS